jgi:hypothetical protein
MVVACVALSFALAGSAVAGTDALNRAVTKSKVKQIAKKQANKQINKKAPGLSVANAVNAQNATNATTAANGAAGYGEFSQAGGVRPGAFNMNNLTLSTVLPGIYCEDQAFKAVTATAGFSGNLVYIVAISRQQLAELGATPADVGCPAASEWVYVTVDDTGAITPSPFQAVGH